MSNKPTKVRIHCDAPFAFFKRFCSKFFFYNLLLKSSTVCSFGDFDSHSSSCFLSETCLLCNMLLSELTIQTFSQKNLNSFALIQYCRIDQYFFYRFAPKTNSERERRLGRYCISLYKLSHVVLFILTN